MRDLVKSTDGVVEPLLVLVGPTAPPVGGVSVHIDRLCFYLAKANFPYSVISTTSKVTTETVFSVGPLRALGLIKFWRYVRGKTVIVHSSDLFGVGVALFYRLCGAEVAQFIHNGRSVSKKSKFNISQIIWRLALSRLNRIYVVNEKIKEHLCLTGISACSVKIVNPYLPPSQKEVSLPDASPLRNLVGDRKVLAWCGLGAGDRSDIYGLDFFLELALRLNEYYGPVFTVIAMGEIDDISFLDERKRRLISLLGESVYIVPLGVPFVSVLNIANVLVRPTSSDGDSVSLREAMSLGVSVVASDVVGRPPECVTFSFGNINDCFEKVLNVLQSQNRKLSKDLTKPVLLDVADSDLKDVFDLFERLVSSLQH